MNCTVKCTKHACLKTVEKKDGKSGNVEKDFKLVDVKRTCSDGYICRSISKKRCYNEGYVTSGYLNRICYSECEERDITLVWVFAGALIVIVIALIYTRFKK